MPATTHDLPLLETHTPDSAATVCALLREAQQSETPVYPIGGGTSLAYGRPAMREGIGLSLAGMQRIVDYPARDMTITVEAGIRMAQLQQALAAENQQLPVEVPHPEQATLGGVIATAWNGPRRLGYGPLRDYVIGIEAVEGRGTLFHGGGRVVKNVAGYDFCKLLTGSLGTLGVVTHVTLKLRPIAAERATVVCGVDRWESVEKLLASLASSSLQPVAVNLMAGENWASTAEIELAVNFEGSKAAVDWQVDTLTSLCQTLEIADAHRLDDLTAERLAKQTVDFPTDEKAAIVLKATVVPSRVTTIAHAMQTLDPRAELLAHAATGVVFIRLAEEPDDLGQLLQAQLRPLAGKHHGQVTLLWRPAGGEMTSQMVWGGLGDSLRWMHRIKQQFDPAGILNPGRFVF